MGNDCVSMCQGSLDNGNFNVNGGNTAKGADSSRVAGPGSSMLDNSGKYLDQSFPPTKDSLIKGDPNENQIDLFPSEVDMLNSTEFRRLSDINGKTVEIFNGIDPNDIV